MLPSMTGMKFVRRSNLSSTVLSPPSTLGGRWTFKSRLKNSNNGTNKWSKKRMERPNLNSSATISGSGIRMKEESIFNWKCAHTFTTKRKIPPTKKFNRTGSTTSSTKRRSWPFCRQDDPNTLPLALKLTLITWIALKCSHLLIHTNKFCRSRLSPAMAWSLQAVKLSWSIDLTKIVISTS